MPRILNRRHLLLAMGVVAMACSSEGPSSPLAESTGAEPAAFIRARGGAARAAVLGVDDALRAAAPALVPPGAPLAPFIEARLYAIGALAMHDALNAIVPRFERYADTGPLVPRADPAVAVLAAAEAAMRGAVPGAAAFIDEWYATAMAQRGPAPGREAAFALGARVAAAILARRAGDGTAGGGVAPYSPGSQPGDYRFTFPFNTPGFDFFGTGGFADASQWGNVVTPFVVPSTQHFRAPAPYDAATNADAVLTPAYTSDFAEVKLLGCAACPARSAEQTEIATFWVENSPTAWGRIAQSVARQRHLDAWRMARLMALLHMGQFDIYATTLESKYYYNFWRPVTAIAEAATDGNPATETLAGWEVLAFPTPPVPDYPSAHASAGGAAAAVMEALLPGKGSPFTATSGSLPGAERHFPSVAAAAEENAISRVYVGFHFRHAVDAGLAQGRAVGSYVAAHALRRRGGR